MLASKLQGDFPLMLGRWRDNLSRWGVREWSMTGLAFVVICLVVFTATRGLAFGPDGEIVRLRFGGDAQRTRVVLDLGRSTRGQVIEDGSAGRAGAGGQRRGPGARI